MGELDEDALEVVTEEEEATLEVTLVVVAVAALEVVVAALEVVVAGFEVVVGARAAPRPGANTTFELDVDTKTGILLEGLLGACVAMEVLAEAGREDETGRDELLDGLDTG